MPFWTPLPPATPRMLSRCPTARLCWTPETPAKKPCTVRLGGPTCLAGDVMGDYSFTALLAPGQRLVFGDMAIYTTCKNNTFNGMPLPDIWLLRQDGSLARLAHFGYQDFHCRLGGRGEGALIQHLSKFECTVSAGKTAPASGPLAGNSKRQSFFAKFGMAVTIAQQISPVFVTFFTNRPLFFGELPIDSPGFCSI